ncbi:MAG TPA: ABC transporter permease [Gemmataceae bacterium]|nr:ABC transporter permease [Gemmataceae bacterium]
MNTQIDPVACEAVDHSPAELADHPVTIIGPAQGWQPVNFREIWRSRELMYFLAWRDLKTRYKQTVLGGLWAVLQPLATMAIFTIFLGKVAAAHGADGGAAFPPYWLFVFTGMLPWTFFANSLSFSSQSVVTGANLITKIYFPRLIIPVAAAGVPFVDLAVSLGILSVLMLFNGVLPGWSLMYLPFLVVGLSIAALGLGILLAALTVAYRDFRSVIPFMIQLWFFATPAIYIQDETIISPRLRALLPLNPAHGLIVNFRQAVLGGDLDLYSLAISVAVSAVLAVIGCFYFRRVERTFADII